MTHTKIVPTQATFVFYKKLQIRESIEIQWKLREQNSITNKIKIDGVRATVAGFPKEKKIFKIVRQFLLKYCMNG